MFLRATQPSPAPWHGNIGGERVSVGRYHARDPNPRGTNEERVQGIVVAAHPCEDSSGRRFEKDRFLET